MNKQRFHDFFDDFRKSSLHIMIIFMIISNAKKTHTNDSAFPSLRAFIALWRDKISTLKCSIHMHMSRARGRVIKAHGLMLNFFSFLFLSFLFARTHSLRSALAVVCEAIKCVYNNSNLLLVFALEYTSFSLLYFLRSHSSFARGVGKEFHFQRSWKI